jgi:hypothetical protein
MYILWHCKFHTLRHIYVGQSRTLAYEDKSVNKGTQSSRSPRFHEMLIRTNMSEYVQLMRTHTKPMPSVSHHDNNCNARDVATELQTTDPRVD